MFQTQRVCVGRQPKSVRPANASAAIAATCGIVLVPMGLYFALWRPRLLPEDVRFIGSTLADVEVTAPNISPWLGHVFRVLGGHVIANGILTTYVASTTFRQHEPGSMTTIALAGATSIGTMTATNLLLDSDFKKPLIGLAAVWALALFLHIRGK